MTTMKMTTLDELREAYYMAYGDGAAAPDEGWKGEDATRAWEEFAVEVLGEIMTHWGWSREDISRVIYEEGVREGWITKEKD